MTETLQLLIPIFSALGIGSILPKLIGWIIDRVTNRDSEERDAWRQRDHEARLRRDYEEVLHKTRLWWHRDTGKDFDNMPPPPNANGN